MSTKTVCECGHAIHEHTYSEDYSGCDVSHCNCSLDLGGLIDKQAAELATAKARAKTAEENWHKNEAKTGHMNNALTTCVMFLVNTNTITEEKQVELIKSLRMAGLVDLADSVSVGGFASVFEGVA